jgi:uncharacterized protein YuzE
MHLSRRSNARVANIQANKERMVELVRKKRIVGITCFYEQKISSLNNIEGIIGDEQRGLMSTIKRREDLASPDTPLELRQE